MSAKTKRIPRAIREQQMLDSAIRVFADLGYRSASMDTIARDANISKPMLYLYYGSKEELFSACVARESGRLIEGLTSAATGSDGPRDSLESVVQAFLEFVDANTDSWTVVYRQAMAEPVFRDEVEKTRSVLVDLTADLLAQNSVESRSREVLQVVATALVGAGEAVANQIAAHSMPTEVAAGVVVDLAWRGLAGGASRPQTTPIPTEEYP
ncbi:TetR family transcriptional regulator [Dietzia sp. NCCP-2495]|uniref:TetR/AcrR family transcriptional regulator n=1 Tax=Dietzia sp. NCCP-2495 TaxID=2934675 RepID=UPI002231B777|nr:TetR/AcrR family transcriptional regulator [Dietzia sp. NCCP-2495]GLB63129.1 TetR family transcriptional regulator [Dietzia sp. NCCP-2495]